MSEREVTDLEITRLCAEAMGWKHLGAVGVDLKKEGVESPSEADRKFPGAYWCISGGNDWWLDPDGGRVCAPCQGIPDPLHDDAQAMALVKRFELFISRDEIDAGKTLWFASAIPHFNDAICQSDSLNRAICLAVVRLQQEKPHD